MSVRTALSKTDAVFFLLVMSVLSLLCFPAQAEESDLTKLIQEAMINNPDIRASQARIEASRHRISQVKSLPDPSLTFGYQNEGFDTYTYGDMQGSQWMFGASQMFPFPGKLSLKGEMAERDAESLEAMHELLKLKTAARIKEIYYDLFLAYKNTDLLKERRDLFVRIEDLALARYGAGKAMQQEVVMAQTEKYMLLEKEEMFKQKIRSFEAMLRSVIGRDTMKPFGRPISPAYQPFMLSVEEAIRMALNHSPEIKARNKMIDGANTKVQMAQKEYYPDFTINAGYFNRAKDFKDMWAATATVNIPIYFKTKQEPAVKEAKASLSQAKQELEGVKLMIAAAVQDNIAMIHAADKLMDLYKNGLIPKNTQDVELALTGYGTGRTEAIVVISRLKTLLDYETLYWSQFTEREKAIARIQAITEGLTAGLEGGKK